MSERLIVARKATPPYGLPVTSAPLAMFAKDVEGMRRITKILWARRVDYEGLRDTAKRVRRQLGKEAIPGRASEDRDLPCDPLDVVLTVAGILWPGLKAWDEDRGKEPVLADIWWGRWGENPGAAIMRSGVLHLVYLDRDAERMGNCDWAAWASANWNGLILHHGIQLAEEESAEDSQLIRRLRRQGGSRGGCMMWVTRGGVDLRPWRADFGGNEIVLRPLGEAIRIAATPGSRLPLRNEWERLEGFWTWLRNMIVPAQMKAQVPEIIFVEAPPLTKPRRGSEGAMKGQGKQPQQPPLLSEVFDESNLLNTQAEMEFGTKLTPNLGPERIQQMLDVAKLEMTKATRSRNRRDSDRWRSILSEIESLRDAVVVSNEKLSAPPGGCPLVAPSVGGDGSE